MSRLFVLMAVVSSGCSLFGTCPDDVEPLVSGTYELSFAETWAGERLDVRQASAIYDRDAGELLVTYTDADGVEVVQELDVGEIDTTGW